MSEISHYHEKFLYREKQVNTYIYVRAAEHMGISHLTDNSLKNLKQSAISDHMLTCDCNISFNDFTILFKDSN